MAQCLALTQSSSQPVRTTGIAQLQPGNFTLYTDAGPDPPGLLPDGVSVLRVRPGAKELNEASKVTANEFGSGDRLLVRGRVSPTGNSSSPRLTSS